MEDIIIRRMRMDELDKIQALYALQTAADTDPLAKLRINGKQHEWEMRRIRQQWILDQKYVVFVASLSDEIIGYVAAIIEQQAAIFDVRTFANIGEFWVLDAYRHRGIGCKLMEELLHDIDGLGIRWVSMQVPCDDELHQFLEKFGFRTQARELRLDFETLPIAPESE